MNENHAMNTYCLCGSISIHLRFAGIGLMSQISPTDNRKLYFILLFVILLIT